MDVPQLQLRLALDFSAGTTFGCPRCAQLCGVHDTTNKEWKHLDFWHHRTDLRPRVTCAEHGVLQVEVPLGAGRQRVYDDDGRQMILLLGQQMSVSVAARFLRTTDQRLWRVIDHDVMAKDRESEALGEFADAMAKHGAKPEQITEIAMDMSPA
jgi:transposase